jgi:hypothetical protein
MQSQTAVVGGYYDPTGQFLSFDPDVTSMGQPYSFVEDDPVNASDPSGLILVGSNEESAAFEILRRETSRCHRAGADIDLGRGPIGCNQVVRLIRRCSATRELTSVATPSFPSGDRKPRCYVFSKARLSFTAWAEAIAMTSSHGHPSPRPEEATRNTTSAIFPPINFPVPGPSLPNVRCS